MLNQRIPVSVRLILGLLAFILAGTLLLSLPTAGTRTIGFNEAIFTSVSALSVTGLSTIVPATDLTPFGKAILMCLIQIGGVGYMVLAILVLRIMGRAISLPDRMALQDALGLLNLGGIVQLSIRVFVTVLVIEAVGGVLLFLHWSQSGVLAHLPPLHLAFYAVFHAVSSFCNAGFDLFYGRHEFPTDAGSLSIMGMLIFLGGLGIPVLFDVITHWRRRVISLHTKLTAIVAVSLVVWGGFAIFVGESVPGGKFEGMEVGRAIGLSIFQSVSCRTAGISALGGLGDLRPGTSLVMMTLMFIGCAPASMGGGITTGTFAVMVLALVAYVRRRATPVIYGKAIPGEMIRKAGAVLTISLFAVLTATWLIVITHPTWTLDEALFEVVSAFATCGLTLDKTLHLNSFGEVVIMVMMIWGRLGALTLLFALTRPSGVRRVKYPEEKILIG
ncbi:MAG: TrkH family potassium uptake protein [Fimbriimonadaceae bacterium]